jgi:uncharacterized protein
VIRVVLDTNVIVSALLKPDGPPAQIVLLVLSGNLQLCVSGTIYAEYEEVLRRPRFQFTDRTITGILGAIRDNGFWVRPEERATACSDPDDNIFLECAQATAAHYLVTGNLRHFPVSWAETRIVTPRSLLDSLLEAPEKES